MSAHNTDPKEEREEGCGCGGCCSGGKNEEESTGEASQKKCSWRWNVLVVSVLVAIGLAVTNVFAGDGASSCGEAKSCPMKAAAASSEAPAKACPIGEDKSGCSAKKTDTASAEGAASGCCKKSDSDAGKPAACPMKAAEGDTAAATDQKAQLNAGDTSAAATAAEK